MPRKVFRRDNFATQREWLYFCLEFDLQICVGCQHCARRRPPHGSQDWYCDDCPPAVHRDLWESIRSGRDVGTVCGVCGETVRIRDCWISEDCQRLYCEKHLEPIRAADRFRFTRRYLERGGDNERLFARVRALKGHLRSANCSGCSFNGRAIYREGRILEIDRGGRSCDCAPDALNCAGIDADAASEVDPTPRAPSS